MAADHDYIQLLNMLRDNNNLSQKQYHTLVTAIEDKESDNDDTGVLVSTEGGLELSSYDGQFSFELGGRLMIDMAVLSAGQRCPGEWHGITSSATGS